MESMGENPKRNVPENTREDTERASLRKNPPWGEPKTLPKNKVPERSKFKRNKFQSNPPEILTVF